MLKRKKCIRAIRKVVLFLKYTFGGCIELNRSVVNMKR